MTYRRLLTVVLSLSTVGVALEAQSADSPPITPRSGPPLEAHLSAPGEASVSFRTSRPAYVAVFEVFLARGPRLVYVSEGTSAPKHAGYTQAVAHTFSLRTDSLAAHGPRRYLLLIAATEPFAGALDPDGEGFLADFPSNQPYDVTQPSYVADVIAKNLLTGVARENMAASVLELPRVDQTFRERVGSMALLRCGGRVVSPVSGIAPADVCAATAIRGRP
jgi:hypothetical protein